MMSECSKTSHSLYMLMFSNYYVFPMGKNGKEPFQTSLTFEFLTLCYYLSNEILLNLPYRCL